MRAEEQNGKEITSRPKPVCGVIYETSNSTASSFGGNNGTVYGASWVAGRGEASVLATIRKYYYLGGRRIAMRVEGDPDPNQNGLFYFHSDHPATSAGL